MSTGVSVLLKNDLSELERVRQLVEEFGTLHELLPKMVFQINLALDEIISNIILYAYEDEQEHEIDLTVSLQSGVVVLTVADDGKPFNPFDVPQPDLEAALEERDAGGLGVYFVRQIMDAVEYLRVDGNNRLILKKNVNGKQVL